MFVCKSISLANYLISSGLNIVKIDLDRQSKGFVVFLFKKDKLLDDALKEWTKMCKN